MNAAKPKAKPAAVKPAAKPMAPKAEPAPVVVAAPAVPEEAEPAPTVVAAPKAAPAPKRPKIASGHLSPAEEDLVSALPKEIQDHKQWHPAAMNGVWPAKAEKDIAKDPRGCLVFMIKKVEHTFTVRQGSQASLLAPLKLGNVQDHAWTASWSNVAALTSLEDETANHRAQCACTLFGVDLLAGKDDPDWGNVLENAAFFYKKPKHCHLLHGHLTSLQPLRDAANDELPPKTIALSGVGAKCHAWSLVVGTFNSIPLSAEMDVKERNKLIDARLRVWRSVVICCAWVGQIGDIRKTEIEQSEAVDKNQ